MIQPFKKKLVYSLIGLLILMVLIIIGFLSVDKFLSKPLQINDIKIDSKAAGKLSVLNLISKKKGIKEWKLTAASATLLKNEDKAILIDVSIIFFTKDSKKVLLTSKKGILHTKTHNMLFSDNVVVTYETSVLTTDKLHYDKKDHIIYSDMHVTLKKENSVIEADSMTTRLNDNTTILEGHVKGNFSDNFDIQ